MTARIGVTLGDPSGIGPEIAARAIAHASAATRRRIVVFGDRSVWERALAGAAQRAPEVGFADCGVISAAEVATSAAPGRPSDRGGLAQVAYLEAAARAAVAERIAGLVTAPISKLQARRAGFSFPGHTEFLAARLGAARVAMMFAGPALKVILATIHLPLVEVASALSEAGIADAVVLAATALSRDFGLVNPRIGVLGLNPHAGEGGLIGREEIDIVAPAVELSRRVLAGAAEVIGPLVPDAAFRDALAGAGGARPPRHDALVALYHDQGLIPVKLIDFEQAVNVTLGLPIVRTSPDHGVAYDIAGTGRARDDSFRAALALAVSLVDRRAKAASA